jgi:hypothetical protein
MNKNLTQGLSGMNPINTLKCAILPLLLMALATFCVYWPDDAEKLFEPFLFALFDMVYACAMAAKQFVEFIVSTTVWIFLRDYLFIPFNKISFFVLMPIFCVSLWCACVIHRTTHENKASTCYRRVCTIYRAMHNLSIVFLLLFLGSFTAIENPHIVPLNIIVITISAMLEVMVVTYAESKNGRVLAWDFKHAE